LPVGEWEFLNADNMCTQTGFKISCSRQECQHSGQDLLDLQSATGSARGYLHEEKMADIETRAITDTATRWGIDEKLVDEIIQDYTEMIENFERYINERYPNENMNVEPYITKEITKKAAKDIADKYDMDEEVVRMIIQDYTEMIRDSLEREMLEELD